MLPILWFFPPPFHFQFIIICITNTNCTFILQPVYLFVNLINGAGIIQSQLPFRKVCSACKLNCSALCEMINDSPPVALKSHPSCSGSRCDVTPVILPCNSCKKHSRNPSRNLDANSLPAVSAVAEQSDRVSDQNTEKESFSSAMSTLTNANSVVVGNNIDSNNCHSSYFSVNPSVDEDTVSRFADDDNVSLHHFCESSRLKTFVSRSFDENSVNVRSNSVSAVAEEGSWRCKTCICLQDNVWRMRSVSTSSRASSWTSESRMRLKSDPNLKTSLPRIQSHHSSSDEEWFEEVEETTNNGGGAENEKSSSGADRDIERCIEFELDGSEVVGHEPSPADPLTAHRQNGKRGRKKYFLFCIPTKWGGRKANEKSLTQKNRTYFRFLSSKNRKCRLCCLV